MEAELSRASSSKFQNDLAQIGALLDEVAQAVREQDVDTILAAYASDSVLFDVRNLLQYPSLESLRDFWEQCFASVSDFGYELKDLTITVDENIAFSTCLKHVQGTTSDGQKIEHWLRVTDCFRRLRGRWLVVHEHVSVPGDFASGKILQNLQPPGNTGH